MKIFVSIILCFICIIGYSQNTHSLKINYNNSNDYFFPLKTVRLFNDSLNILPEKKDIIENISSGEYTLEFTSTLGDKFDTVIILSKRIILNIHPHGLYNIYKKKDWSLDKSILQNLGENDTLKILYRGYDGHITSYDTIYIHKESKEFFYKIGIPKLIGKRKTQKEIIEYKTGKLYGDLLKTYSLWEYYAKSNDKYDIIECFSFDRFYVLLINKDFYRIHDASCSEYGLDYLKSELEKNAQ
ncbi:hypothetical protein [Plebeiibacterium sediminum]|uniref:Uncharacterized protein n=1 Tax=Plebeiibacterium sediminum TaxID=2992112 RepID=A0AAE3M8F1_9BACT|nr:hypothetical protein [Plebeiobacterium sediminum]MCW3788901.1 hypothetical protein [Plebeiobacterium sediminum]